MHTAGKLTTKSHFSTAYKKTYPLLNTFGTPKPSPFRHRALKTIPSLAQKLPKAYPVHPSIRILQLVRKHYTEHHYFLSTPKLRFCLSFNMTNVFFAGNFRSLFGYTLLCFIELIMHHCTSLILNVIVCLVIFSLVFLSPWIHRYGHGSIQFYYIHPIFFSGGISTHWNTVLVLFRCVANDIRFFSLCAISLPFFSDR